MGLEPGVWWFVTRTSWRAVVNVTRGVAWLFEALWRCDLVKES
jgi:hypothetical protein